MGSKNNIMENFEFQVWVSVMPISEHFLLLFLHFLFIFFWKSWFIKP